MFWGRFVTHEGHEVISSIESEELAQDIAEEPECIVFEAELGLEMHHDDETLRKVFQAIWENGIDRKQAGDIINSIQNAGIYFREEPR